MAATVARRQRCRRSIRITARCWLIARRVFIVILVRQSIETVTNFYNNMIFDAACNNFCKHKQVVDGASIPLLQRRARAPPRAIVRLAPINWTMSTNVWIAIDDL
jgi:hypothetical protein